MSQSPLFTLRTGFNALSAQASSFWQDVQGYGVGPVVEALVDSHGHNHDVRHASDRWEPSSPWLGGALVPPVPHTFTIAPEQSGISGGVYEKAKLLDESGNAWLYKPNPESIALREVVVSRLMNAVGIATPDVRLHRMELGGKATIGSLQPLIPHADEPLPRDPSSLSTQELADLTRIQVATWLVGDHDRKSPNFLRTTDGHVVPIDFGNAFRLVPSDRLAPYYQEFASPNYFAVLADAHIHGTIALDRRAALDQVARFEALPDQTFKAILRPQVEARYAEGFGVRNLATPEAFLDLLAERKRNLRTDVTAYYDRLDALRAKVHGSLGHLKLRG